jgi:hypothetical protein
MRRGLALALLVLVLPACGGDDGGGGGASAGERSASPGLLVAQRLEDGELVDTLELLDPERPGDETVDVADVARGIPVGVNQALYEQGAEIVLLDAEAGEVTDLGLQIGDIDLNYSRASVAPGGERYVVLLAPTGEGAALVDLEDAEVTDLLGVAGDARVVLGAEMAGDGSAVLLNTDAGVHLVPTDDPDAAVQLGEGAGQLLGDGDRVLLTGPDGVVLRDLDADEETVVSEEPGGALVVGDRVLVGRDDEAVLLDPGSDDVLASAPFSTSGAAPVAVGETVLLPSGDGWTLVDGADATATPIPELDGLTPTFSGRPSRWVPFGDDEPDGNTLVAVDTEDGSVVDLLELGEDQLLVGLPLVADAGSAALVSTNDPDGTEVLVVDLDTGEQQPLGTAVQGAAFSPDGGRLAWSRGEDAELRIAPVDDLGSGEVVADGLALPIWLNGG